MRSNPNFGTSTLFVFCITEVQTCGVSKNVSMVEPVDAWSQIKRYIFWDVIAYTVYSFECADLTSESAFVHISTISKESGAFHLKRWKYKI